MRRLTDAERAAALERKRAKSREHARRLRAEKPDVMKARLAAWQAKNPNHHREYAKRPEVVRRIFERHLLTRYGMTLEDFARLEHAQDRKCAGCLKPLEHGKKLHVDHDHVTARVRGLLCNSCNHALGMVDDSVATLARLISYLERNK